MFPDISAEITLQSLAIAYATSMLLLIASAQIGLIVIEILQGE